MPKSLPTLFAGLLTVTIVLFTNIRVLVIEVWIQGPSSGRRGLPTVSGFTKKGLGFGA